MLFEEPLHALLPETLAISGLVLLVAGDEAWVRYPTQSMNPLFHAGQSQGLPSAVQHDGPALVRGHGADAGLAGVASLAGR